MRNIYNKKSGGQVVMMTVLAFLVVSLAIISAVVVPTANQIKSVRDLHKAKQGYLAADSVNEEAFYRLNKGQTLPATLTLPFGGGVSASAVVTDTGSTIEVATTGTNGETIRHAESVFSEGEGYSFNYGLQVGNGGLTMSQSAIINGNVYSNGNITGSQSARITGSAVAAAVSNITAEVTNSTTTTPTGGIDLGRTSSVTEIAQSFLMTTTTPVLRISINMKKIGATNPANLTLEIRSDSGGNPTGSQKGSDMTISAATVGFPYGWIDVYPSSPVSLNAGQTYWIRLISGDTNSSRYYNIATSTGAYSDGVIKTMNSSGTWSAPSPSGQDALFEIYTGYSSTISGMDIGGTANAFSVNNSHLLYSTSTLYCQTGSDNTNSSGGSISCDTSQAPPSTLAFPVSSANIDDWIASASSGWTRTSSLSLGSGDATTTSGALKIVGNLNLSSDAIMTLNGPLYVTGDINISQESIVKLGNSLGATDAYVVVGGLVSTSQSGQFQGNGTAGSYIVVASKDGNFNISQSAGSVVIITLNGTANFSQSASAKAVVARQINMSQTSSLNYESGLTNVNFTTGPSGSWTVDSWGEVAE